MQASVSQDREKYYGGSDIPIIMGISPFKTRFELLQEKAGLKEIEEVSNEYIDFGNMIEPKIREYINQKEKDKFYETKHIDKDIRIHTDGENKTTILEIKSTSIIHDNVSDYEVYLPQLLFYMINTNKEYGKLAVYERPKDFNETFDKKRLHIYDIKKSDYKELCERILHEIDLFKRDLSKLKENPFLTEEDLLPKEIIALSSQLTKLEETLLEMKAIEDKAKEIRTQLAEKMEEYGIDKWITPQETKITLVKGVEDKEVEEEYYNEDLFIQENPELHEQYHNKLAEYKEKRLVLKKGKKSYLRITPKK